MNQGSDRRFWDSPNRNVWKGIDYAHHEIHDGKAYIANYQNAALPNGNSDDLCITTPAGVWCHTVVSISATGQGTLQFISAPNVAAGVAVTPVARNRGYGAATTVTARNTYYAALGGGTILQTYVIPGGTGPRAIGASWASREEWVLNVSTVYCLRFSNSSGGNVIVDFLFEWYETSYNP